MYRETLNAAALACALDELRSATNLSDKQIAQIWSTFDRTMDETLNEVPSDCQMTIHTAPPTTREGNNASTTTVTTSSSAETTTPSIPAVELASPSLEFPLYRIHDGMWTVILKDPSVTIRTSKRTETIQLDYLKCYLKDNTEQTSRRGKRPRT
ncbi:Hypothetical protein, putative [Bodo saltans]|uniref:Uncharacterized protein n=1 Tax=Bodo saltans TaxID=75058 RepID=A0A0S4JM71_BODSA|nr:Hypothetical protein, putative [Bodo saltans]|eukprot:CUG91237.1 Hypothetical protein, putative [Bodo saltans]